MALDVSSILVTGGAGYIGSILVPKLLARGHRVTVLDFMFFGRGSLDAVRDHPSLTLEEGDIRNDALVARLFAQRGFDMVYHLAAVSNDPCSSLAPAVTRSINLTATRFIMHRAAEAGVRRFVYASSASVYGVKDTPDVTEALPLEPMTLYARYKAEGEDILNDLVNADFCGVSVRAATVCGYSPRLRLDLTVNILTHFALTRGSIRVFGGDQMRPNIHIEDLTDFYAQLVDAEPKTINGRAFNVSTCNATVMQLANMVRDQIDPSLDIHVEPTEDKRSYHLSAERARAELGFVPRRELAEAVCDLRAAYRDGRVRDPENPVYRNIESMKNDLSFWTHDTQAGAR